jgi:hypothetical protein
MKDLSTSSPAQDALPGGEGVAISAVQIPRRKRGAPPGNRNRWKHGRYSKANIARRAARRARITRLLRESDYVLAYAWKHARGQDAYDAALRADADALACMPVVEPVRRKRTGKREVDKPEFLPAAPARSRCRAGRLGISSILWMEEMVPRREVSYLSNYKHLSPSAGKYGLFVLLRSFCAYPAPCNHSSPMSKI